MFMKKVIGILVSLCLLVIVTVVMAPLNVIAFSSECTGGTITHLGGNTIHTFTTTSSTFDCTNTGGGTVQVLVVAGGGGGAGANTSAGVGGGGGGGGYQEDNAFVVTPQAYSITVGNGGSGGPARNNGNTGQNSIFSTITAYGGGGGGTVGSAGFNGGSGGGGGGDAGSGAGIGGTGSQGGNGGAGTGLLGNQAGGGGGGAAPENGNTDANADGGDGKVSSITGSPTTYAGGGGGAVNQVSPGGVGGIGGGGNGNQTNGGVGQAGGVNTGGGGGGGGQTNGTIEAAGGDGGSGIVIISYPTVPPVPTITGSGIPNRLAKFSTATSVTDSLFSDDGTDTTLTSGNFFMQAGSLIDSVTSGVLNFGINLATTMTFGRLGQNVIINSKVGIGTSTPVAILHINGDLFASLINVAANGMGLDTYVPGLLAVGSLTANAITIGHTGIVTTIPGSINFGSAGTTSNCSSTTSPAVCGSAPAGSVAMATGVSTLQVNTTAVTPNSQIFVIEDSSLGSRLGIICNMGTTRRYTVSARTAGTSFTIKSSNNPTTNKACLSYFIVN